MVVLRVMIVDRRRRLWRELIRVFIVPAVREVRDCRWYLGAWHGRFLREVKLHRPVRAGRQEWTRAPHRLTLNCWMSDEAVHHSKKQAGCATGRS